MREKTEFAIFDPEYDLWECQSCRSIYTIEEKTPKEGDFIFCPHCGLEIDYDEYDNYDDGILYQ